MYIPEANIILLMKAVVVILGGIIIFFSIRAKGKLLLRIPFILIGLITILFGLLYFK